MGKWIEEKTQDRMASSSTRRPYASDRPKLLEGNVTNVSGEKSKPVTKLISH